MRTTPTENHPISSSATSLRLDIILELVDLYFDLIHDQFHTLFHRPTFTDEVAKGEGKPAILYAMLALSARCV